MPSARIFYHLETKIGDLNAAVLAGKRRSSIWKAPSVSSGGADRFSVFENSWTFAELGGNHFHLVRTAQQFRLLAGFF